MKKTLCFLFMFLLALCFCIPVRAEDVVLSPQNLTVDGREVACEKYNIDGSNYFKLRDLALLLNGTESQFSVGWEIETSTVIITTGMPYVSDGTELVVSADKSATTVPSAQTIMIDGLVRSDLTVYNIGGNNYFQLRQLGRALGFDVDYSAATNTARVFSAGSAVMQNMTLTVNRETGEMSVFRPTLASSGRMGPAGTWTVFVYHCGTDLESEGGMATDDMLEMIQASGSDNVRFVVETGGANYWNNNMVDSRKLQRYVVQNGEIELADEAAARSMGDSGTLSDFLSWGVKNYPAAHMGVVLWDHGGGSISGVCFDERNNWDSLSLREIDEALLRVFGGMSQKFDFIGFDACLMATVEMANILASYADYMIASEEVEPGTGWDYTAIGNYLAAHPEADGLALGKVVCDSYLSSCKAIQQDSLVTLSVIDLSRVDAMLQRLNSFFESLYQSSADAASLSAIVRGIERADNFGGNNRAEGYTNMVDLGALVTACSAYTEGSGTALSALKNAVAYQVSGYVHKNASGLSMYYPLCVQGSGELAVFGDICISPYYLSFVDRKNQGSVNGGDISGYDDDHWYDDNDNWNWADTEDGDYWDYINGFSPTGESSLITFSQRPTLNDNGTYFFVLDTEGLHNTAAVYAQVFEDYGHHIIELGESPYVDANWSTGYVGDSFDGSWLSLPDGQNLALYVVEETQDYVIYTAPIKLNGSEAYLRVRESYTNGSIQVEGAWDGISESGAAGRELVQLKTGDKIVPLYYAFNPYTLEETRFVGSEYVVSGTLRLTYERMESSDYLYAFRIDDIYGDYYLTDFVTFGVEDDGSLYFIPD